MRSLELNQMEQIEGGSCANALGGLAISGAGLLAAEMAIAATFGPVGFGILGISYAIAWASVAYSSGTVVASC